MARRKAIIGIPRLFCKGRIMTCILCRHGKAKKFGRYGKAKI